MLLLSHLQYRGIPDLADIDKRVEFSDYSAFPTGIEYYDAITGGNDHSADASFEGLSGGRLALTVVSTEARYLRFPVWDLADPTLFRRVLFEIEGLYMEAAANQQKFISLRDTIDQATYGVTYAMRVQASATSVAYNNAGSQPTNTIWKPVAQGRGIKHTIGVGWEANVLDGTHNVLVAVNGLVAWRSADVTIDLGGSVRPSLIVGNANNGTVHLHGARMRLWRHT